MAGGKPQRVVGEEVPAWAQQILNSLATMGRRLDTLETRSTTAAAGGAGQPNGVGTVVWLRCEGCGEKFEGVKPPFGSPAQCVECQQPGLRTVDCSHCGKRVRTHTEKGDVVCKSCAKCVVCGDGTSDEVCFKCIQMKDGNGRPKHRICESCRRLAPRNSPFCEHCQRDYSGVSAARFKQTEAPEGAGIPDGVGVLNTPPPGAEWQGGDVRIPATAGV